MPQEQSSQAVKIYQLIFGALLLGLAIMSTRSMMAGGSGNFKMVVAAIIALTTVLALDKYYWILLPILTTSGIDIPGLPFSGRELGCLAIIGVYMVRSASHKTNRIPFTRDTFIVWPLFVWICIVWCMNPTGLAIFGSATMGARFYMQIMLAFMALHVIASIDLSERDCKILFRTIVICSIYSMATSILKARASSSIDLAYSANQTARSANYELLGALTLYTLMFAKSRLLYVIQSPGKLFPTLLFAAITIYTGKRRGFGSLALIPIFQVFLTGKDRIIAFCFAAVGAFMLVFAVLGDGAFYELPRSAKRALSVVVPRYADETGGGYTDTFRENVRDYAKKMVRDNPWCGRKGFAMSLDETVWMNFGGRRTGTFFEGHAYSGNWHSTWWAFGADFGIPAMVFWGLFVVYAIVRIFKIARSAEMGTYAMTCALFYGISLYIDFTFSYTSGHSALTPLGDWPSYGMLLAIANGIRRQKIADERLVNGEPAPAAAANLQSIAHGVM